MERKVGRPPAGQEALSRERILAIALRVVDAHGLEALTMRRLARELGVDPMAIYHHIPSKDALVAGLVRHVFAGLRVVPTPGAPWEEGVRAFARAYRAVVRAHPYLTRHLIADAAAAATGTLEAGDVLYATLAEAGLPPRLVVRSVDVIVDYIHGFALAEVSGPLGYPSDRDELLRVLDERPTEAPALRQTLASLDRAEYAADFEFGLNVVLAGIKAVAATPPPARPAQP